ncbi:hypothetical protein AGMMS49928_26870 [Spirochaetia bacterium]|nr:hypothetical protein AGMMS49928_26870 [Spirochaetia bacterium]
MGPGRAALTAQDPAVVVVSMGPGRAALTAPVPEASMVPGPVVVLTTAPVPEASVVPGPAETGAANCPRPLLFLKAKGR